MKRAKTSIVCLFLLALAFSSSARLGFSLEKTIYGLAEPSDVMVATDGGIYVADGGVGLTESTIRVYNGNYEFAQRIGGWGSDDYNFIFPTGVYKDSDARLYVADFGNNRVQVYNPSGIYFKTMGAGIGGTDVYAFASPKDVFIEEQKIYVADTGNDRIIVYNKSNQVYIAVIGLLGGETETILSSPSAVHAVGNKVYIADTEKNRIAVFAETQGNYSYETSFGRGLGGVNLNKPEGIFADQTGRIFVSDTGNNRIAVFKPDYSPEAMIYSNVSTNFTFNKPRGLWVQGDKLFVANSKNGSVAVIKITETITASREAAEEKMSQAIQKRKAALDFNAVASDYNVSTDYSVANDLELASTYLTLANQSFNAIEYSEAYANASNSLLHATNAYNKLYSTMNSIASLNYTQLNERFAAVQQAISSLGLKYDTLPTRAKLRDLNASIAAKNYSQAFTLIPQIEQEIRELEISSQVESRGLKLLKQNAEANLSQAKNNLGEIEEINERYKQELNLSEIEEDLKQADYALSTYAFDTAVTRAEKANKETASLLAQLENKTRKIGQASQAINDSKTIIAGIKPTPIIGPDLNEANEKIAQAEQLLYSQPEEAKKLALEAQAIALAQPLEITPKRALLTCCPIILIITLALLATIFFLHKKRTAKPRVETEEEKLLKGVKGGRKRKLRI